MLNTTISYPLQQASIVCLNLSRDQEVIDAALGVPYQVIEVLTKKFGLQTNARTTRCAANTYIYGIHDTGEISLQPYDTTLRTWHLSMGVPHPHVDSGRLVVGAGSTQILGALFYALEKQHGPLTVYQPAPGYLFHKALVEFAARRSVYVTEVPQNVTNLVEIVTTPNNPDGHFRIPFSNASILIVDLSYLSPLFATKTEMQEALAWMNQTTKTLIAVCSMSKTLGMAGNRIGYTFLPENALYLHSAIEEYKELSSLGYSPSGLADVEALLKQIEHQPVAWKSYYHTVHSTMVDRHQRLAQRLQERLGAEIHSHEGRPYLFMRLPSNNASALLLETYKIKTVTGTSFNMDERFARFSLFLKDSDFEEILRRLAL